MKNPKIKTLMTIILIAIMLISVFSVKSLASDSNNTIVVEENENLYLIYVENMLDENFNFAFSNTKEGENLNYVSAATDNEGNYIAYADGNHIAAFFNEGTSYVWVKDAEGKVVINGEQVNLNAARTIDELKEVEDITKNITIKSSTAQDDKITINGNEEETYFYQFDKVNSSEEYTKLLNLINEVTNYDENTNMFVKLQSYNELYDLYNLLLTNLSDENWAKLENLEITKPYDAKENGQYILWVKDSQGNLDMQILTAYEEETTVVTEKTNTETVETVEEVEETAKTEKTKTILPYTYDEATPLFVALGVVLVLIASIVVFKAVSSKNRKD